MRRIAAFLVAACVAGCQTDNAGGVRAPVLTAGSAGMIAASPNPVSPPFRCPEPGTRVTFANGSLLDFQGPDPSDPAFCLMTNASGQRMRRFYNIPELPWHDEAVRSAIAGLWPMSPGKEATYTTLHRFASGSSYPDAYRWRVLRVEPLDIGGEQRRTWVVERNINMQFADNRSTIEIVWYDEATWQAVRRSSRAERGMQWSDRNFDVLAIGPTPGS